MATDDPISIDRLKYLLAYNSITGNFRWRKSRGGQYADRIAGHKKTNGYVEIMVDGWLYGAHRLAWFYYHGEWPGNVIDHINGDRADNRIANLRHVSHAENVRNVSHKSKNSSAGYRGVWRYKDRFRAEVMVDGVRRNLGLFFTAEEASAAYVHAKARMSARASKPRR